MMKVSTPEAACADILKLVADPTRLYILRLLAAGPKVVKEINAGLAIGQNLLSHHLKTLKESGFLLSERRGKSIAYSLAPGIYDKRRDALELGCCKLTFAR
ncbi:ArsR/SmtB family transcription factor [Tepidicaulis sp.]|jgi:ArsR family transcriptional regulator|uniref:ArsR/SmtB family transcription factor n=1 Tax=Tepidicaulis sp. TaxID=1920809 RepID=UPI003B5B7505